MSSQVLSAGQILCAVLFKPFADGNGVPTSPLLYRASRGEGHISNLERGEGVFAPPGEKLGVEGKTADQCLPDEHPL